MRILFYFIFAVIIAACSGKNEKNKSTNKTELYAYIDVDPTQSVFSDEEKIQLKIVLKRLYDHVEIINDQYVITIQKGSEINISEELFLFYKKSIEMLNRDIKRLKRTNPDTVIVVPPLSIE